MGDQVWTFRGDCELDPILEKWTKQNEKSFHVRQALRQYCFGARPVQQQMIFEFQPAVMMGEEILNEPELSLDEWR